MKIRALSYAGRTIGVIVIPTAMMLTAACGKAAAPALDAQPSPTPLTINNPLTPGLASSPDTTPQPAPVRIETRTFDARESLGRLMNYSVLLPAGYDPSKKNTYTVIFLLHGLTGSYKDWTDQTDLRSLADKYSFVIVMPDGNDSWYIDSSSRPQDRYETYLQSMVMDARKQYQPAHLVIAGLSMGGYGAVKMALKYPTDRFDIVGSFSGAFAIDRWGDKGGPNHLIGHSVETVFGPVGSDARAKNDIYRLTSQLTQDQVNKLPFMYISTGREDNVMLKPNRDFVAILKQKNVPPEKYSYDDSQPGGHDWKFWGRELEKFLDLVNQKLGPAPQ